MIEDEAQRMIDGLREYSIMPLVQTALLAAVRDTGSQDVNLTMACFLVLTGAKKELIEQALLKLEQGGYVKLIGRDTYHVWLHGQQPLMSEQDAKVS